MERNATGEGDFLDRVNSFVAYNDEAQAAPLVMRNLAIRGDRLALVFLALNGVGLGHLVRTTALCKVLESVGERPVVFSQGMFPLPGHSSIPGKQVPSLWNVDESSRTGVASDIRSVAEISLPAVLVEDTHPNPIKLPRRIRRILIVRPTTFEYLCLLHERYDSIYSAFLLCDCPGSPTWPYSEEQTGIMLRWQKWTMIGPIYRKASPLELVDVRRRYDVQTEQRLCVFSMGGGGQQHSSDPDTGDFVQLSIRIADQLRGMNPKTRCILVQGPYFISSVKLPSYMEVVRQEPQMPALLACAHAAFIRAGFNTTWECLAAGTPFLPFIGTTFAEPTSERLQQLSINKLLAKDLDSMWNDESWRGNYRNACRELTQRWRGMPDAFKLQDLILNRQTLRKPHAKKASLISRKLRTKSSLSFLKPLRSAPFVIRIDDVISLDDTMVWLLHVLSERKLNASLEVVPYFSDLDEGGLQGLHLRDDLFEVSQHGYAHIPAFLDAGRTHEFSPFTLVPSEREERAIRRGKALLEADFPTIFRGGFSPPYDGLPTWFPALWKTIGGRFISTVFDKGLTTPPLPMVRAGIDIWRWSNDQPKANRITLKEIEQQLRLTRYSGIILHPRCLRNRREKARLVRLLDRLLEEGARPTAFSQLANGPEELMLTNTPFSSRLLRRLAGRITFRG